MALTRFDRRYFHNILTHYDSIMLLKKGGMPAPRFCTLQTSNRCNQRCRGCSFGYHDIQLNGRIMSWTDHKKILEDLLAIGVQGFEFCGGGEPTCMPYLLDAMKFIRDSNCYFGMITNGVNCSEELINFVVDFGSYVRISLETAQPSIYVDYKRCPEWHYSHVLENVTMFIKQKHSRQSSCDISVKFGVSKSLRGYNHFNAAIELSNKLKPDSIQFKCLRHEPEELSLLDKKEQNTILQELKKRSHMPVIDWLLPNAINDVPQCWLSPLHTVVDYLGDVYLCCYYYYREKEHKLGNMLKEPFSKFWYSQQHFNKIKAIDCKKCAQVDCKFFGHHYIVNEAFKNGRMEFL